MNLSPEWETIFDKDYEVQHWTRIGLPDAPDTEILEWAKQRTAVILTNDLDFGTILAASHLDSPSVFQIRSQILALASWGAAFWHVLKPLSPI